MRTNPALIRHNYRILNGRKLAIITCMGIAIAPVPFLPIPVRAMFLVAAIGYASRR